MGWEEVETIGFRIWQGRGDCVSTGQRLECFRVGQVPGVTTP